MTTGLTARCLTVLALPVLFLAACAGAAPGESQAPSDGFPKNVANIGAFLDGLLPAQRLEWRDLEQGCGDNGDCRADLDRFRKHLQALCPQADGCADPVADMLYRERTTEDRAAGRYSAQLPRVEDVRRAYRELESATGGGG